MTDPSKLHITETAAVPAPFSIAVEARNGTVRIAPTGELDLATVGHLEHELRRVTDAGPAQIVIDLSGVEFLDCSGLRVLLTAADAQGQQDSWELKIIPGSHTVQRIFELTRTADRLPFTASNGRSAPAGR